MALPPVFIEFLGSYTGLKATVTGVKSELATVRAEGGANMAKLSAISKAALLGIGVAAVAVAWKTTKMAADFQSNMLQISTQAGVPKAQLAGLGDSVLALAGKVGFSPDSLAESLYHVESSFASVGIKGPEALDILKIAAEGAATGHANLVDVTNALDAAIASGIPGVQNYSQAMGALNAIVGSGDMQMQDLADAMGTGVLAVVKGYGLSLTDVGAALATFGDNNIRGAAAATDLRMAVQALAVPAHAGAKALAGIGLSTKDLGKDMQKGGLKLALNDLVQHMQKAGVTAKEQGALITQIFGKKAGSGLAVLTAQIDRVNSKYPELTKGANNFGNAVAENQATYNQKMKDAGAAMDALGVKIGQGFLPIVTKAAGALSGVVGFMTTHIGAMEAFAGAMGVVAIAFAAAAIASWSFEDSILADPLTWVVVGIAAVVAGLIELILHWKSVAAWLDMAWHATVSGLATAWHWLASETSQAWDWICGKVVSAWRATANWFSGAWHSVVDPIVGAWHWISRETTSAWNSITGYLSGAWRKATAPIVAGWNWLASATSAAWNRISAFFMKWWPLLLVIFDLPLATLIAMWNHFHKAAFSMASTAWNATANFFVGIWKWIAGKASAAWGSISSFFSDNINATTKEISSVWNKTASFFSGIWNWISSEASSIWRRISANFSADVHTVEAIFHAVWNPLSRWLSSQWQEISHVASAVWSMISTYIIHPIQVAASTVEKWIGQIKTKITSGLNGAIQAVKNTLSSWADIGMNIVMGMVHGVENNAGKLGGALKNVAEGALKSAKSFLGINSPSRLFANEVGKWISHGIAQGVTDHADVAANAVRGVARKTVGGIGPALGGTTSPAMAGSGTVVQNVVQVTVQGTVRSDRDLRDVLQQEMLRLGGRNSGTYVPYRR
jgi:TP901 family phage tail tape measure protein